MNNHYKSVRASVTRWLMSLAVLTVLWTTNAYALIPVTVSGTAVTSPALSGSYTDLATALSAVNAITSYSTPGTIILTCTGGNSETAPATGFFIGSASLNPLLSATNTITLVASGGAVTINAGVGTVTPTSATPDGMFSLRGADFVTIDGLTFTDGNAANPATMEFGIALFKGGAADGCNNNTIQNCTINMQRINNATGTSPMVEGAVGILVINSTATAATTVLTPTNGGTLANNGTNSGNKFYTNTINSGNYGIALSGFAASAGTGPAPNAATFLGDLGNDLGGTALGTGNTILNFGGGAAANPSAGIRANQQWSINIRFNTVNNNNGSGVNHATTFRGIYTQAGASGNATISDNIVTLQSGATTSAMNALENAIGSTAAANTININNNTIRLAYTTATSGVMSAITNSSTAATVNINNNNIQGVPATNYPSTGTIAVIVGGSPGGPLNITNNTVSNFTMTGASGTLRAITASTPTGLYTVTGNTVENLSYTLAASTGSITGIYNLASATLQNVNSNIIRNFSTPTTGTLNGIQNNTVGGTFQCKNNQIYNFSTTAGGAGGFSANGITWSNATCDLSNNIIYSINSTGTTGGTGGTINGITHSGAATVSGNAIYNLSSNSTNAVITGLTVAATGTNNIRNNIIGDLRAPFSTGNIAISGILVSSGTTNNIYHNTVNLAATTSSATTFGSSAIYFSSSSPVNNLKNNIFVNTSNPGPTGGFTAAIRYTIAPTTTNFPIANNNNFYYAGTAAANRVIYCEGSSAAPTNGQQTIANYKTYISTTLPAAGREGSSVSEVPNWASTTGSNPITNFLQYNTGVATQAEQGGALGTGITTDYTGTTVRCPGGGCPGTTATPDMGAWELNGLLADFSAPVITYTTLANTDCFTDRTLSATISDASLVNTTLGTKPRLYYKKSTNANTYVDNTNGTDGWKYVEATNASSPFSFTTNYSLLFGGSPILTDVIQYFVVAQDLAGTPNTGLNSGIFAAAPSSVALTSAAFPLTGTINSYTLIPSGLSGTVTIGAAGTYTSLTGAGGLFSAINTSGLSGNLIANIIDLSVTETGANALNQALNLGCSPSNYTVTIKPNASGTVLTGSVATGAIIKLNGADYVTIDGSTSGGSDRSLSIINTTTTTSGNAVVWLASPASGNGATNNTIKNCIIEGNAATTTFTGIHIGGNTTIGLTSAGTERNNTNTVNNCLFRKAQYGITTFGYLAGSGDQNLVITNNNFGTAVAGEGFSIEALHSDRSETMLVNGNEFQNIFGTGSPAGVRLLDFKSGVFTKNKIHDVLYTGASTNKYYGLIVSSSSFTTVGNPSLALIANNFVYAINGNGTSGVWNSTGILASVGYGDRYYHNTINMSGQLNNSASGLSAAFANGDGNIGGFCNNIDVRNNIFNLTGSSLGGNVWAYTTQATNFTGATVNYNLLNCAGTGATNNTGRFNGVSYATLALWQAGSGVDANSTNIVPVFTSATDLHLVGVNNITLSSLGTNLSATVTDDIDGESRPAAPEMGADEFILVTCSTPVGGTITPGTAFACNNGTYAMSSVGSTTGLGISNQWEISAVGGGVGFASVSGGTGATTVAYTTGTLTTGMYYYRLAVTCSFTATTVYSNELTLTVNPQPSVSVTPTTGSICNPGGTPIALGASGAVTYSWAPASGLSATTGANVSANPSLNTTYTVTGTDANNCTNTATAAITSGLIPTAVTITPPAPSLCLSGPILLTASGGTVGGSGTATIGAGVSVTGATAQPTAFCNRWPSYRMQTIFTAAELSGQGITAGSNLTSMAFDITTLGSAASNDMIVKIGHTSLSALTAFEDSTVGFTTVFPTQNYTHSATGLQTIPFSTNFTWNGTSNIIVQVTQNGADLSNNSTTRFTTTAGNTVAHSDFNGKGASATLSTTRLNVVFGYNSLANPTWSWAPGATLDVTNTAAVTATPTITTTYTATATVNGCSNSNTVTVTIGNPLVALPATTSATRCAGTNFTVTANSTGGGAPFNYAWSDGVGGIYPNAATITANLANGTYAFSCTITDGCGGNVVSSASVVVNALPTVGVTPGTATYCTPGSPVALAASGASTYAWGPASGLSATTGSSVTASPSSATTYTVTGTDGNGCVNTATAVISTGVAPTIGTPTATPPAVCFGGNSQLNVTASLPVTPASYTFAASTGTYTALVGGTNSTATGDDGTQAAISIGFNFVYAGTTFTQFGISTNGVVQLGATVAGSLWTNSLATVASNILAPMWDDNNRSTGTISYLTTGSVGSRVLTVDFNNVSIGDDGTGFGSTLNPVSQYQVQLFEGTNEIKFIYGNLVPNSITASIGINGAVGQFISVTPAVTPTTSTVTANNGINTATDLPSGTVYTFTPPVAAVTYSWSPATFLSATNIANPMAVGVTATTTYTVDVAASGCISQGTVTVTTGSAVVVAPTATPPAPPASVSNYAFSSGTGASLLSISSPTVLTTVTAGSLDDGSNPITPSPAFSFPYAGASYVDFSANTNGWLKLGSATPPSNIPSSLTSIATNGIYAFGRDANMNVSDGGNLTHGAATGGKYVFQFTNNSGGSGGGTSSSAYITMQIVLWGNASSSPGKIEIIYGSSIGSTASNGTIGISTGSTFFNAVTGNNSVTTTASAYPASGTVYTFTPPSITPCPNTTWQLAANASGGGAPYVYSWVPTAGISDPAAANPTLVPTTTTTYTVYVTDACLASTFQTVTVTVQSVPVAVTPVTTSQCGSAPITLTASGATTYTWSPTTDLSAASGTSVVATPTGLTNYVRVYTVTGTLGTCTNTATATVNYTAPAPISIINSNPNICGTGGGVSTLTVVDAGPSYTSYTWTQSLPGTLSSTTGSPVTATITETTGYTVTATDGVCTTTASTAVSQFDFPVVTPTADASVICPGTQTTLNSNVSSLSFSASCKTPIPPSLTTLTSPVTLCAGGSSVVALNGGSLDDGFWNAIPIGFTFSYFGVDYTTLNIGTNGTVVFGASGSTQFNFTGGFPNLSNPANTIAVCARDLQLGATGGSFGFGTGTIKYSTEGVSPNRKFIVQYIGCTTWYSTNATDGYNTVEAVFSETIGEVAIHVINSSNPTATTGTFINDTRNKFIGLQDGTQTIGATAPNCVSPAPNYWNGVADEILTPQAWKFEPPHTYTFLWGPAGEISGSTTGSTAIAAPTVPGGNIVNYTLVVTDNITTCSNSASPAIVAVDVTAATPIADFDVDLTNGTSGGVSTTHVFTNSTTLLASNTYAWSFSPATVTYVGGTTASSINPQVQFTAPGQYSVTLVATGCNGTDTKVLTDYITITAQYCVPVQSGGSCITNVTIGSINNSTPVGCVTPFYSAEAATTDIAIGYDYPISVTLGAAGIVSAWIDFDHNGGFEATEWVQLYTSASTGTVTFSIPNTATAGMTKMRIRSRATGSPNGATDACTVFGSGETEDYDVNLIQVVTPPNCVTSATINAACITQTSMSWTAATGYPKGYKLSVYDNLLNYIEFETDVFNVLAYTIATPLLPATVYNYEIIAYNDNGNATGCTAGTFTSGPSQAVTPSVALAAPPTPAVNYNLGAEGVTVPALPCGVTVENADQLGTSAWYTSTIAPHSGTKHMRIDKNPDNVTPLDDYFFTVPINVSAGKVYRITWWDRASSASFTENYEVRMATLPDASTMLGSTPDLFSTSSTTYAQKQGTDYLVPVGGSGVVYFGFRATSGANKGSIYIDDIVVSEVPVPQINPVYCTTIPSMYDQIFVTPIPGATNYRFKIVGTGGQAGYNFEHYRNNSNPDYRLKWAPGVIYGYMYNVQVASFKSGVWSPYGPSCPVTLGAFPAIKLRNNPATVAGPCDYVISDLNDRILTDSLSGANDYMYKIVEDVPGGAYDYDHTWQRQSGNLDFRLVWAYQSSPLIDRVRFGYSYDVQTRALVGKTGVAFGSRPGEWGPYGVTCKLDLSATSPTTSLTNCSITLSSLNDQIFTTPITGATNYEYEFTAPGYTAVVYRGSGNTDYRLIWIPTSPSVPGGARYATTYTVRVKAYVGGVWLSYGSPCTVTTPAAPTTTISTVGFCGSTLSPGQFSSFINCTAVPGASMYSFRITNVGGVAYSKVIYNYNANTSFSLSRTLVCCGQQNLLPNATYTIEVAYYAGVWSAYGPTCTFTTGATVPRYSPFASEGVEAAEGALNLSVYPNPATINEQYSLELQGITAANEKVQVAIYNMIGDRVYRADVITKEEATLTIKPEMQLAAGVYMAEAQLNGNVYRVKFVVK